MRGLILSVCFLLKLQHFHALTEFTVQKSDLKATVCATSDPYTEEVPRFVVDLDSPPEKRYTKVVEEYKKGLQDLSKHVKNFLNGFLYRVFMSLAGLVEGRLDSEYVREMKGIAVHAGIEYREVVLFNIFYEIFTACTSILAVDNNGRLIHGRNLDFGLFLGWDKENTTWKIPEILRPITVILEYQQKGKVVAEATTFVGYVGVLTGHRVKTFSVTINERFSLNGGQIGILEWLLRLAKGKWIGFLVRETILESKSYDEALKVFSESELLAPVYIILGSNDTRGCVISREKDRVIDLWNLDTNKDVWYVLQGNSDHTKSPPFFDDKVSIGNNCMTSMGRGNLSDHSLFNVLRTIPVRNKLTVFSSLIVPSEGTMRAYLEDCPHPCPPW